MMGKSRNASKRDKKRETFKAAKSAKNCSTTFREQKGLLCNFFAAKLGLSKNAATITRLHQRASQLRSLVKNQ